MPRKIRQELAQIRKMLADCNVSLGEIQALALTVLGPGSSGAHIQPAKPLPLMLPAPRSLSATFGGIKYSAERSFLLHQMKESLGGNCIIIPRDPVRHLQWEPTREEAMALKKAMALKRKDEEGNIWRDREEEFKQFTNKNSTLFLLNGKKQI